MGSELWTTVHAERAALVEDLTNLRDLDWATPSLCAGWDVGDVVAHLAATATLSLPRFTVELVRARLRPSRITERHISAGRRRPAPLALEALRSVIDATASPPQRTITRIIEIVVHGEDIRRPLHIAHDYDTTHIPGALRYLARDHRFGAKTVIDGLCLMVTDAGICIGRGERVDGPAVALLLAASGRRAALDELSGPGVPSLARRLAR